MKIVTFVIVLLPAAACAMERHGSVPARADSPAPVAASADMCPICLDELRDKDKDRCIPCEHVFCHPCLKRWLGQSETCPLCRRDGESERDRPWVTITFIIKQSEIRMLRAVGDKLLSLSAPIALVALVYYCYLNPTADA